MAVHKQKTRAQQPKTNANRPLIPNKVKETRRNLLAFELVNEIHQLFLDKDNQMHGVHLHRLQNLVISFEFLAFLTVFSENPAFLNKIQQ